MQIQSERIPGDLRAKPRWVLWRYEEREGKRTKVPYSATLGGKASTTDAHTWAPFADAWAAYQNGGAWSGIGFVFAPEDDILGIDLDHCRDPASGTVEEWAQTIVTALASYTEVTPSETGLHILCRGKLPEGRRRAGRFEIYEEGRYFTVTGSPLAGYEREVEPRAAELAVLLERLLPPPPPAAATRLPLAGPTAVSDWQIVDKIRENPKYDALWRGDRSAYPSASEADLALVGYLAFFTGPDAGRIDRLFQQSGLCREKWTDPGHGHAGSTYGADTIATALAGKAEFYEWRLPSVASVASVTTDARLTGPAAQPSVASVASVTTDVAPKPLREPPRTLEPEALYGLPGLVVNLILPQTESHAAAILANFLIGAGCMIGRGPHIYRDGGRHAANEFGCLVGLTAAGRKGTSSRRVDEVLRRVNSNNTSQYDTVDHMSCESEWASLCIGGLGSGEALVASLAEEASKQEPELRRFVFEEEFSRCLKVMAREGSTLSEMLRAAWDSSRMENRVKGKVLRAPAGHVSIIGHITAVEMKVRLGETEMFNGFANRFLWFCVERSKLLPFGGGTTPINPAVSWLQNSLIYAQSAGVIEFSPAVAAMWSAGGLYKALEDRPPGLLGAVTARASSHVTRLALIWAVLDRAAQIEVPHLMAALAVWDFSERSCAYLFGTSSGDEYADKILELLTEAYPGYLTRTEIRDAFGRHSTAGRIPAGLELLESAGQIRRGRVETPGRSAECWAWIPRDRCDRSDGSDRSPLIMARELLAADATLATEATEATEG